MALFSVLSISTITKAQSPFLEWETIMFVRNTVGSNNRCASSASTINSFKVTFVSGMGNGRSITLRKNQSNYFVDSDTLILPYEITSDDRNQATISASITCGGSTYTCSNTDTGRWSFGCTDGFIKYLDRRSRPHKLRNPTIATSQRSLCENDNIELYFNPSIYTFGKYEIYVGYSTNGTLSFETTPFKSFFSREISENNGSISFNLEETFGDRKNNFFNKPLFFKVAYRNGSQIAWADNLPTNFTFNPDPPSIQSVTPTAPTCPGEEGSIRIVHGTDTPPSTTFKYTVTQLIYSPTGDCDDNPNLPDN
ncbi:MAG: hypothetical protein WBA74_27165, partial [Cyclobacteriaceae bacterium]